MKTFKDDREYLEWLDTATAEDIAEDTAEVLAEIEIGTGAKCEQEREVY